MSKVDQLARVKQTGIVAVIRADRGELLADVAEALLAGGVDVMEVTFTVPKAHQVLEQVAAKLGDRVLLGAGTVLDAETAQDSASCRERSSLFRRRSTLDVIRLCRRYDKLVMPGAFTPTEILPAWEAGADIVKVFPSDVDGPGLSEGTARPVAASSLDAHRRRQSANGRRTFCTPAPLPWAWAARWSTPGVGHRRSGQDRAASKAVRSRGAPGPVALAAG